MACRDGSLLTLHVAGPAAGSRNVAETNIVHDHAVRIEPPAERANRPLHSGGPPSGHAVLVTRVVEGHNLLAQSATQRVCIGVGRAGR